MPGVKKLACEYCKKRFDTSKVLTEHLNTHTGEKPYKCPRCSYAAASLGNLYRHEMRETPLECPDPNCDFTSCTQRMLMLHQSREHPEQSLSSNKERNIPGAEDQQVPEPKRRDFGCTVCGKTFSSERLLINHVKAHKNKEPSESDESEIDSGSKTTSSNDDKLECDKCSYSALYPAQVKRHKEFAGSKVYKCPECEVTSCTKSWLFYHTKISHGKELQWDIEGQSNNEAKPPQIQQEGRESNSYSCKYCDKVFQIRQNLDIHMRVHTGEKPYKCSKCDYSANQKGHIYQHKKSHTYGKPRKCSQCDFKSCTKIALNNHEKTSHNLESRSRQHPPRITSPGLIQSRSQESKKRIERSTAQPSRFPQRQRSTIILKRRKRMSRLSSTAGSTRFRCMSCPYISASQSNLELHKRIHTGERPYQCPHCPKSFRIGYSLTIHIRTHTGEKPYKCSTCGKGFAQHSNWTTHSKQHQKRHGIRRHVKARPSLSDESTPKGREESVPGEPDVVASSSKVISVPPSESEELSSHTTTTTTAFSCFYCGFSTILPFLMREHLESHADDPLQVCDLCDYETISKELLDLHKKYHRLESRKNLLKTFQ